jgi:hypothetical protein
MMERRVVMRAVTAYWVPPFLGTFTIWVTSPADEVHPRHGGREGETTNDGVEGLGLEFLGDEVNGFHGSSGHGDWYTILKEKNYSNDNFSFSTCFLNFLVLIDFVLEKSCSSSDESSLELVSESYFLNESFVNDHGSGSELLITINSIF